MQEAVKPSPRSQDTTADLPYPLSHSHSHSQSQDADGDGDGDGDAPSSIGGPSPARSSKSTGGVAKTGSRESDVTRQVTRKGRACLTCRKLKVKCGGADQGDGVSCQRCRRLGLDCKMSKRLRMSLDDDGLSDPSLIRLDRSVRAILAKLDMPSLENFAQSAPQPLVPSVSKTTRDNSREESREPESKAATYDIAGAPMEGLYEATHLSALRSRTGGPPTQQRLRKNIESDLVGQGIMSVDEAERMLNLFKTTLSRYLYNATISEERSLQSIRESSSLLFTAIMTVSSLHVPGMEDTYTTCHHQLRDLIASSMFDRSHTLEDIRALCIAAFWLPDLSWKLSGHCVRMATELNLHQAFFKAFHTSSSSSSRHQSAEERENLLERARLWYLLYVLDHHFSIAYGRPPVTTEIQAIRDTELFLQTSECTMSDRRVISQVALFRILSRAYDAFGLEAGRVLGDDDETLIVHARFLDDFNKYRNTFRPLLHVDEYIGVYSVVGLDLHYHFNSMLLNSLALRGRAMASIASLPHRLRPLAFHAIESAHRILEIVLGEPDLARALAGVPLYLHAMIAFAVVFLIKMSPIWHLIGVTVNTQARTRPLVQGIIATMRSCKAGANHILYKMAAGFERLLLRRGDMGAARFDNDMNPTTIDPRTDTAMALASLARPVSTASPAHSQSFNQGHGQSQSHSHYRGNGMADLAQSHSHSHPMTMGLGPDSHNQHQQSFDPYGPGADWQVDDDMLWSLVGTEYDLLANAGDTTADMSGLYTFHDTPYLSKT